MFYLNKELPTRPTRWNEVSVKVTGYRDGLELCVTFGHGLGDGGHFGTDGTERRILDVTTWQSNTPF